MTHPLAGTASSGTGTRRKLGILGGMGPLASVELLHTIYRFHLTEPEQGSPTCLLLSDPSFPDRTEAILSAAPEALDALAERLTEALEALILLGADRLLIACVTIHHLLGAVPEELRRRVISLIDLVIDEALAAPLPRLLLTTEGTRVAGIFESHPRWSLVADLVQRLGVEDQHRLHTMLYRLKAGASPEESLPWLDSLPARYGVEGVIFGCTELHLLHRHLAARARGTYLPGPVLDPLWVAARDLERLLAS